MEMGIFQTYFKSRKLSARGKEACSHSYTQLNKDSKLGLLGPRPKLSPLGCTATDSTQRSRK